MKYIVTIIIIIALGAGLWWLNQNNSVDYTQPETDTAEPIDTFVPETPTEIEGDISDSMTDEEVMPVAATEPEPIETIGQSVSGETISAYHFGSGETEVLLVGGAHGGYSPNTITLADDLIDYYETNEARVPSGVLLTIIPNLNPDGSTKSGAAGRFNANDVDLNRNFDCEWSATGMWRDQEVSGGSAPFSEPEAKALRDYIESRSVAGAIVLFSQEGKVYPSACDTAPSVESVAMANTYAVAAGYPTEAEFDAYTITGDMVNWMAKQGIPAISVLLTDHQSPELTKNLAGVEAVLAGYAE